MAAGSTYTAIATQTLGSNATSVTFSSIPSTYTDLVLVMSLKAVSANDATIAFNGDSGTNYSLTNLQGNGSSAISYRYANQTSIYLDSSAYVGTTNFNTNIVQIMNYSNTTTYKTLLGRAGAAATGVDAVVGLWRSTAAINSLVIAGCNYVTGSTFSLYGIAAA